jgi:hypothetical protein
LALIVTGCGKAPTETTPEPTSTQPRATVVIAKAQATAIAEPPVTNTAVPTVTLEPTNTAIPTATPVPSPTPTVDPVVLDDLQRGYVVLVMLEATTGALEELATQIQAGTIEGMDATGSLIALAAMIGAVKEVIDADAPTRELSPAWAEAREALAIATEVVSKWFDKVITSAEVPDMLAPAREHVSVALVVAEKLMKDEYGVTEEQLAHFRSSTEAEFRAIVSP